MQRHWIASLPGLALFTGCSALPAAPSTVFSESDYAPSAAASSPRTSAQISGPTQQRAANLNLIFGQRTFDDIWAPNEDQFTIGMEFDTRNRDEWLGLDAGFHYSEDEDEFSPGVVALGQTTELFLGARKTFTIGRTGIHPYVAAGGSLIWVVASINDTPTGGNGVVVDRDDSFGLYARGGAYWTIAEMINVGIDLRALFGTDITVDVIDTADYTQFSAFIGWAI